MPSRYSISLATVVLLVVLRLNIGWHFFSEGVHHLTDPQWSSEAFLRSAKGPLAPLYRSYLPDFHGMDQLLYQASAGDAHAAEAWSKQIQTDWDGRVQEFSTYYRLDDAQQKQAARIKGDYQAKLRDWMSANAEDLDNHVHQTRRNEANRQKPGSQDVPYQKQRIVEKQATLNGEAAGWRAQLAGVERDFENALGKILTPDQRQQPPLAAPRTALDAVDGVMTYAILVIGLLLLLGLFTRTACVAGAGFLLSVVLTQPFWVSEAAPTFNQFVEMFALLTLATTQVGRWAGLDFFVHNLIVGRNHATKGTSDVSGS